MEKEKLIQEIELLNATNTAWREIRYYQRSRLPVDEYLDRFNALMDRCLVIYSYINDIPTLRACLRRKKMLLEYHKNNNGMAQLNFKLPQIVKDAYNLKKLNDKSVARKVIEFIKNL